MATTEYRKAFAEAAGDKDKYMELCKELPERHQGTARLLWSQFESEIRVRSCVVSNGNELLAFLRSLPASHMEHTLCTAYSEGIESGYAEVSSDPNTKSICIVGSEDDV